MGGDGTARLSLLAASCWLAICNASSPEVRSVRVPTANGGDIPFRHVSLETAPVRGLVNRIVQDDQGFLWFGTNHGLLRYDGYEFRAFVHDAEDPNSISAVNVMALSKDRRGNLWIGSTDSVDRYDPASGIFKHFPIGSGSGCGPTGAVRDISEDRGGTIWLATDNGLKRLDPSTSKLDCYKHRDDDDSSIASNFVKTVVQSRDGTLWVATTPGLETVDPHTGKTGRRVTLRGPSGALLNLDGNKISVLEDHAGVLWISIPGQQECGSHEKSNAYVSSHPVLLQVTNSDVHWSWRPALTARLPSRQHAPSCFLRTGTSGALFGETACETQEGQPTRLGRQRWLHLGDIKVTGQPSATASRRCRCHPPREDRLTTAELEELAPLRKENRILQEEREIS